jgi:hypothetical protein
MSGTDQTLARLIQVGVKHYILGSTSLFNPPGIMKNCHSSGRNLLLYLFIERARKLNPIVIDTYNSLSISYKNFIKIFLSRLTPMIE